jgi:hypothetical protein
MRESAKYRTDYKKGKNHPMFGRTGKNNPMFGKTGEKHHNSTLQLQKL